MTQPTVDRSTSDGRLKPVPASKANLPNLPLKDRVTSLYNSSKQLAHQQNEISNKVRNCRDITTRLNKVKS